MDFIRRLFTPFRVVALCITFLLFFLLNTRGGDGYGTLATLHLTEIADTSAGVKEEGKIEETKAETHIEDHVDMRIAILTFITHESSYTHLSLQNHQEYATLQNYDLVVDFSAPSTQGLMWHKLDMMERTIAAGSADWMWWIDFDTLITNSSVKLSDIIKESLAEAGGGEGVDLLVSKDCGPLNAGSMLVRSSPSSLRFLATVREYGLAHPKLNEQECIREVITANENGEGNQTHFVPQRKINAYPEEIGCFDEERMSWQQGDFVIHFAGAWAYLRDDKDSTGTLMRKYAEKIGR